MLEPLNIRLAADQVGYAPSSQRQNFRRKGPFPGELAEALDFAEEEQKLATDRNVGAIGSW